MSNELKQHGYLPFREVAAVTGPFSFLRDVHEGRVEARKIGSHLWIRIADLRDRVDPVLFGKLSAKLAQP